MSLRSSLTTFTIQIDDVSRLDRWHIQHRLQELLIPAWCPEDGSLWVEVNSGVDAVLVWSTVQHFVASRLELVNWLERCWHVPLKP